MGGEDDALPTNPALLALVFGSDSEGEGEGGTDRAQKRARGGGGGDEKTAPEGLLHVPGFLSKSRQEAVLKAVDASGWFDDPVHNQVMRFGVESMPPWGLELSGEVPQALLPPELRGREPLFDQMIVNLYRPGEGIVSHVDLARFEDGIASFSFGGEAIFRMRKAGGGPGRHSLLLRPGDLVVLSGPARYDWEHGIDAVDEEELWGERVVRAPRRVSVTLRRLGPDRVLVAAA